MQKTLSIIVLSAFVLAACQTPHNPDTSDVQFNNTQTGQDQTQGLVEGSQTSANFQLEDTNIQQEESMKQLSDFKAIEGSTVTMTTSKGDIEITLFREEAPLTTLNFLNLIDSGFYDGIIIHRVEPNFVVQFGDPLTKEPGTEAQWGTGGPGYVIPDEFHPQLRHSGPGTLSMANRGPNTGSSQIFITLAATEWLDDRHAVFGTVSQGMDVVNQLQVGDVIQSATYH
ncbi:MAG: peptidylprolyl isomerase [Patescibacteria group bacterium]